MFISCSDQLSSYLPEVSNEEAQEEQSLRLKQINEIVREYGLEDKIYSQTTIPDQPLTEQDRANIKTYCETVIRVFNQENIQTRNSNKNDIIKPMGGGWLWTGKRKADPTDYEFMYVATWGVNMNKEATDFHLAIEATHPSLDYSIAHEGAFSWSASGASISWKEKGVLFDGDITLGVIMSSGTIQSDDYPSVRCNAKFGQINVK